MEDKLTPIEVTCSIGGVAAKAGNCAGIRMSTVELSFENLTRVLRLKDLQCVVTIKPFNNMKADPIKIDGDINQKTPSQRLRGAIHVWWQQSGKKEPWETFYVNKMESLLDYVKDKLD